MSRSKDKGTAWETRIVRYLAENGFPHVERRALSGTQDRGDIAGVPGVVIEAKNVSRNQLAQWVDEALLEQANDGAAHAAVWHHRTGKASAAEGYVTMTGAGFVRLLRQAGIGNPLETCAPMARITDHAFRSLNGGHACLAAVGLPDSGMYCAAPAEVHAEEVGRD